MTKKRIRLACTLSFVALAAGVFSPAARADVSKVWLGVAQVTCGSCGIKPHKELRFEEARRVEAFPDPAHVEAEMKPGIWPDISRMQSIMHEAGFTPRKNDVRLTVSGTIRREGQGYKLELIDMTEAVVMPLTFASDEKDAAKGKDTANLRAALEKHVGQLTTLEGAWQSHDDKKQSTDSKGNYGVLIVSRVAPAASS